MALIRDTIQSLTQTLDNQLSILLHHQDVHFDWLRSVEFQLSIYSENPRPPSDPPLSLKVPSQRHSSCDSVVRFVDGDSGLLEDLSKLESDGDDSDTLLELSSNSSYDVLTQSASSFHAQWQETLIMKKAQSAVVERKFRFKFDDNASIPETYDLTDDEDVREGIVDQEIDDKNPFEIHGKVVPLWARQDNLLKDIRAQKNMRMDGDQIFHGMDKICPVGKVFGVQRTASENDRRGNNRSDDAAPKTRHRGVRH